MLAVLYSSYCKEALNYLQKMNAFGLKLFALSLLFELMGWGARGREMRKRFNMYKSFNSPHRATIWTMLKGSRYCCSHCRKCWEGEGRKVSHSLLGCSTCLFLQFLKFSNVLNAQGRNNCLWSLILCCCRPWENSSGETQEESVEMNAVLTPAQQPTGHMSAETEAESAGPWTWSTDHRFAVIEKRVWRRGENLFASWDQNKMFSI